MAATVESRVLLGQCHAEGGITDGCYALYGAGSNAEQVDCVLAQINVGRGEGRSRWEKGRPEGEIKVGRLWGQITSTRERIFTA